MGGFTGGRQLKPEPSGRDQQQKLASILNERCRNSDTGQPFAGADVFGLQ